MPGPHDPTRTSGAGLVLRDTGEETGKPTSLQEERAVKGLRTPTRFWLMLAALLLGLATLALGLIFFSNWPGILAAETIGGGLALLATCFLLLTGAWRGTAAEPISPAAAPEASSGPPAAEPDPAAALASPDAAPLPPPPPAPTVATLEPPAAPAAPPTLEPAPEAAAPDAAQAESSAATAPDAADAAPPGASEPAPAAEPPAPKPASAKTGQPPQNGHAAAPRRRSQAGDAATVPRPPLTNLPQSYPRPTGGYALDEEAEDLSQLLGDVAEQTVIAIATRGQRGVERRERMAGKIDSFSREMAVDPNLAPVVAYLESISALLRAGKPIPASKALVDPFDGLYNYVLTLIRRKTGRTHD